jgi:hypothetical protein
MYSQLSPSLKDTIVPLWKNFRGKLEKNPEKPVVPEPEKGV